MKKWILMLIFVALSAMMFNSAIASADSSFGPAPNSGDGIPDGSGLDAPNECLPLGHNDYCRDCGPCNEGQGDCDNDGECAGDLTCPQVDGTDICQ